MNKITDLKKGTWSVEEDEKLISYINKYGIWNWSQMPRFAGLSRSGKSCRLRWMNYLKPNVKRGKFSKEETEILLHLHSLLGNRWSAIASRLPGRTDNDVKNYWHTHLKKYVGEQNQVCKTTERQNDITISPTYDAGYVENMPLQPANHMNAAFESQHVTNDYDYDYDYSSISSFSNTASSNHPFECRDNYVDTGSPGTIDDFQGFWDQLGPVETLELINNNHLDVFSDYVFQDTYNDPRSSYSFYNNNDNI